MLSDQLASSFFVSLALIIVSILNGIFVIALVNDYLERRGASSGCLALVARLSAVVFVLPPLTMVAKLGAMQKPYDIRLCSQVIVKEEQDPSDLSWIEDNQESIDEMKLLLGKMAMIFGISVLELMITLLVRLIVNEPDIDDRLRQQQRRYRGLTTEECSKICENENNLSLS